jgi:hypothetical protein
VDNGGFERLVLGNDHLRGELLLRGGLRRRGVLDGDAAGGGSDGRFKFDDATASTTPLAHQQATSEDNDGEDGNDEQDLHSRNPTGRP